MSDVDAVLFDLDRTICVYERSADEVLSGRYPLGVVTNGDPGLRGPKLDALGVEPDPRPHHVVDAMHDVVAEPWG